MQRPAVTMNVAAGGRWSQWQPLGRPSGQEIMAVVGLAQNKDGRLELSIVGELVGGELEGADQHRSHWQVDAAVAEPVSGHRVVDDNCEAVLVPGSYVMGCSLSWHPAHRF